MVTSLEVVWLENIKKNVFIQAFIIRIFINLDKIFDISIVTENPVLNT